MKKKYIKKEDTIRDLLLKVVGKNPDLFCYYVSLQEAKDLLGKKYLDELNPKNVEKPYKKIVDC